MRSMPDPGAPRFTVLSPDSLAGHILRTEKLGIQKPAAEQHLLQSGIEFFRPQSAIGALLKMKLSRTPHELFNKSRAGFVGSSDNYFHDLIIKRKSARVKAYQLSTSTLIW